MDIEYAKYYNLPMTPLRFPFETFHADETKAKRKCTHETHVMMECNGYKEWIALGLTILTQPVLLGYNWF